MSSVKDSFSFREEEDKREAIAVIGISIKFPGGIDSLDLFWRALIEARCTSTQFPHDRVDISTLYNPDGKRRDTLPIRGGHFISEDVSGFDAPFFSIGPSEAASMDPQQRYLLEASYRALENGRDSFFEPRCGTETDSYTAGIPIDTISGSRTSVYNGCFTYDYHEMQVKDIEESSDYSATGLQNCMNANRVSWFFNFTGPSMNIDTACSSSLVGLDLACQSLINHESDMSLVTGCNLLLSSDMFHMLSHMGMLSKDSRCFSFDSRANGYARGEGFAALVVKRLSDAMKDGDTIRSIIRSSGSNQDGHTQVITQPNEISQQILINETYAKAGLSMRSTRFVEAHGTGTAVGDPLEARALGHAFRDYRTVQDPLYIGAVKSNIGHLGGAAGLAGVIKTILVLEKGMIPPNANFKSLNSRISAAELKLQFPLHPIPWPSKGLRRASCNSFGIGGSNAHIILEDVYHYLQHRGITGNHCTVEHSTLGPNITVESSLSTTEQDPCDSTDLKMQFSSYETAKLLSFSAFDQPAMQRMVSSYIDYFQTKNFGNERYFLDKLAFTLNSKRTKFPWKCFAVAGSIEDLKNLKTHVSEAIHSSSPPKLGFIFTGQGAQWAEMCKELFVFPKFASSFQASSHELQCLGYQFDLKDELLKKAPFSDINRPHQSQVLCTCIQIALVDLLRSFNIYPAAVVGHSAGEIAAAYCVGAISQHSACKIAYFRGYYARIVSQRNKGAMLAVALSEHEILPYMQQLSATYELKVVIACVNSDRNLTISGDEAQIDILHQLLQVQNIFSRKLQVDLAYHSPHMEVVSKDMLESLSGLERGPFLDSATPVMFSSLTGEKAIMQDLSTPRYWVANAVSQVKFAKSLELLCNSMGFGSVPTTGNFRNRVSSDFLLELGPHSALQGPVRDIIDGEKNISYSSFVRRHISALETTMKLVGKLYCSGVPVDLHEVNFQAIGQENNQLVLENLPEYPFDHSKKYWKENQLSMKTRRGARRRHDLLGRPDLDWNPLQPRWKHVIRASEMNWLEDHKVNGSVLYPASGMIAMAVEALRQITTETNKVQGFKLKNITFQNPLHVPEAPDGVETMISLSKCRDSKRYNFQLCAIENTHWIDICRGSIVAEKIPLLNNVDDRKGDERETVCLLNHHHAIARLCSRDVDTIHMYEAFAKCGFNFGETFQTLEQTYHDGTSLASSNIKVFPEANNTIARGQSYVIHPSTLDGVLHLALVAITQGGSKDVSTFVPAFVEEVWISNGGLNCMDSNSVVATSAITGQDRHSFFANTIALDSTGTSLKAHIKGLKMSTISKNTATAPHKLGGQLCSYLEWKPHFDLLNPDEMKKYCESSAKYVPAPIKLTQELRNIIITFISRVLTQIDSRELSFSQPHFHKFVEWMREQLTLSCSSTNKEEAYINNVIENNEQFDELCTNIYNKSSKGKLFVTFGRTLYDVLSGNIDGLDLLFGTHLMTNYYHDLNNEGNCFHRLGPYIDILAHSNPCLNILEIGGGTGSATTSILGMLKGRFDQYMFTDISPSFFESARASFQSNKSMEFKTLDIENDPASQGFQLGVYDVIVASNVLHATKNLDKTLRNARSLLKPGGKMILFEITKPDILGSCFIVGILPGWWLGAESYRARGPCVTIDKWHEKLLDSSFSGVDIEFKDFEDDICHELSLFVTSAVPSIESLPATKQPVTATRNIILADTSSRLQLEAAEKIAQSIELSGMQTGKVQKLEDINIEMDFSNTQIIFCYELERPFLLDMTNKQFSILKRLLLRSKQLHWITAGGGISRADPAYAMIDGLSRVLRNENSHVTLVTIALDYNGGLKKYQLNAICKIMSYTGPRVAIVEPFINYEPAFIEIDGNFSVGRVIEAEELSTYVSSKALPYQTTLRAFRSLPLALNFESPGILDTICFSEDENYSKELALEEVEIEVFAVGINFKDCLKALGRISTKEEDSYGSECSGIVTRSGDNCPFEIGDKVLMSTQGAFKTYARAASYLSVCKMPSNLSFAEAAAIPTTFLTAWQCLVKIANLERGESILIHSGAGGTGQAAIQIAQYVGATIYTTVGTKGKKDLLIKEYGIPEDHIFWSRDASFVKGIKDLTNSQWVDVVLNSLTGENLIASWECIAPHGRFIDIGKKDVLSDSYLPMGQFSKNVSFNCFDGQLWLREKPRQVHTAMTAVVELVQTSHLRVARPLHVYNMSHAENAFRAMQDSTTTGKIVVEVTDTDQVMVSELATSQRNVPRTRLISLTQTTLMTKPSFSFDSASTYLIAGAFGGVGRSLARWMVSNGARNLILLSRSGAKSAVANELLVEIQSHGANAKYPCCDISDFESLKETLDGLSPKMPPIRGCVQAAMELNDRSFEKMDFGTWRRGVDPKVRGSWNLHKLLPSGLDFFILLSSASGIVGFQGQSNYNAGNTFMDALAHYRNARGESGTSIDLGALVSDGFLAEKKAILDRVLAAEEVVAIQRAELFALLEYYCNPARNSSIISHECQPIIGIGPQIYRGNKQGSFSKNPTFNQLQCQDRVAYTAGIKSTHDFKQLFIESSTTAEAISVVCDAITMKLSKTLFIKNELDLDKPLQSYGVDSLLVVELRNWFAKTFGADLTVFELSSDISCLSIEGLVTERSLLLKKELEAKKA
ncbi:hypothetical protein BGAL_0049g00390 [Botrytis galanthina]|uniref:Uncharacterized protein n=1 Tax=Botrytis galanthina TaxID=278940 RepID=A0A4S8RIR6_9HELO|nr:hypothetical protein BGAL_0049g00390 [Botrytis galanthina]